MKKKVLFSIVAVALFAVAMALNSQKDKNEDLTVKNAEAIAGNGVIACTEGGGPCLIDGIGGDSWINHLKPIVVRPESLQ